MDLAETAADGPVFEDTERLSDDEDDGGDAEGGAGAEPVIHGLAPGVTTPLPMVSGAAFGNAVELSSLFLDGEAHDAAMGHLNVLEQRLKLKKQTYSKSM